MVPVIQVISILVALLVNRPLRGIGFFRTAYYVPVVTSFAVVGLIWSWLYQQSGPVNTVLMALGLMKEDRGLLNNPATALLAVMFVTLWKGIGYYMVLYLAGLQSISTELEEAAIIDGATRSQVFWNITLPSLRPTILVDQGTADEFLETQLRPELLEAACAGAGIPLVHATPMPFDNELTQE